MTSVYGTITPQWMSYHTIIGEARTDWDVQITHLVCEQGRNQSTTEMMRLIGAPERAGSLPVGTTASGIYQTLLFSDADDACYIANREHQFAYG